MGIFRKKPEELLMREAIRIAQSVAGETKVVAQGGGGGVETRWRGASRILRSMASWIPGLGSPQRDLNPKRNNPCHVHSSWPPRGLG